MNKRILLIRLSAMGDVIFNIPLANILKNNGYEVTWLVSEKGYGVVKDNPAVDEAILAPVEKWKKQNFFKNLKEYLQIIRYLRSKHFDIAIDTQLLLKSFIWTVLCGAKRRIVSKSARECAIFGGNEVIGKLANDYTTHAAVSYLKFAEHLNLDTKEIKTFDITSTINSVIRFNEQLYKDIRPPWFRLPHLQQMPPGRDRTPHRSGYTQNARQKRL